MKSFLLIALSWLVFLAAPARADVSFDYFYEELAPYGVWLDTQDYGYCWRPNGVSPEWAPYTDGYWVYTEAGWTWVSYENFGPLTYHYGRWVLLDGIGWVWRPDYEWGPAWVSWRWSDDYVGWAPLPPEAVFEPEVGIGTWVDRDYDIGPGYYNFCRVADFGSPALINVIYPRRDNVTILYQTVNITHITVNRGYRVVYNQGPDYHRISRHTRRPIETLRLERRYDVARNGRLERARRDGNRLVVAAPRIERHAEDRKKAPRGASRKVETVKVDRGWASVNNRNDRQRLEEKIRHESKDSPRTRTPVKPVEQVALPTPRPGREAAQSTPSSREDQLRRQPETGRASMEAQRQREPMDTRQREAQTQRQEQEARQRESESQQREAQKQRQQMESRQREAEQQRAEAEARRRDAESQQREMQRQRQQMESRQREADRQRAEAEARRRDAESQQREMQRQRQQMESRQREAERQRAEAEARRRDAESGQREMQRQRQQMESRQRDAERQQAESQRQQQQQQESQQRDSGRRKH